MTRITIFVGRYGSGKTEVAINYALGLLPGAVDLVDLDVATPYFRVRDVRQELVARSLRVLVPGGSLATADVPVLPAGLAGSLAGTSRVVLDVGGDATGARVLGSIAVQLDPGAYVAYFVVNPNRPFTRTVEGIEASFREIQEVSGVRVDGMVVNSHLGAATTAEVVVRGYDLVEEASRRLGMPVAMVAIPAGLADQVAASRVGGRVLALELFLRPPWAR
ncbi:MAG: hypothetical protein AB1445_06195 [Bacillota bacterium]